MCGSASRPCSRRSRLRDESADIIAPQGSEIARCGLNRSPAAAPALPSAKRVPSERPLRGRRGGRGRWVAGWWLLPRADPSVRAGWPVDRRGAPRMSPCERGAGRWVGGGGGGGGLIFLPKSMLARNLSQPATRINADKHDRLVWQGRAASTNRSSQAPPALQPQWSLAH